MAQRTLAIIGLRQEVSATGGTANTVAKFTGPSTLGDSSITDDGTTIAVTGIFTVSSTSTFTALLTASAGINVGTSQSIDGTTRIDINGAAADTDVRIGSDTNATHFVSDAGLFSGVGGHGFGAAAGDGQYFIIQPPILTAPANQSYFAGRINPSQAVTIPAGTAPIVAALSLEAPSITATGTVSDAYTFHINGAPTAGTRNGALWITSGISRFDDRVQYEEGANITAANTITLGNGNIFNIVGTTVIQQTTTSNWQNGAVVRLKFNDSGATVAHNTAASGLAATILTSSAGTYTAVKNSIIQLVLTTSASVLQWNLMADAR